MQFPFLRRAVSSLLLGLLLLPGITFAGQLIMKNGDIITGKVTKVVDGKVYIDPSYASEYGVDIAAVVSIDGELQFEIELADGSKVSGQLGGASEEGQILIIDGTEMTIGLTDLARATEPESYYSRSSQVDVNATFNSGNTDSQNTLLFTDTKLRLGDHRHLAELTFRRDETDGISTKKQDLFNYQYNWLFNDPWYVGATATYERDPIRDLSYRYTLGVLAGRDLLNDSSRFLTFSFGTGYSNEKIGGLSDSGSVGLWNLIYTHRFHDGAISFFHDQKLNYQFYGDNNAILKTNTGFQFDIISNVYAKISLRYDYETEPATGASKDDTTLAIGVGAKF